MVWQGKEGLNGEQTNGEREKEKEREEDSGASYNQIIIINMNNYAHCKGLFANH